MKVEAGYVTQQSQEPTNRAVALNQPEATEHTCLMAVPNSMRAVQLRAYGVSRSMAVVEMPVPRPGAGEVLVRLRRSGQHDWVRKC